MSYSTRYCYGTSINLKLYHLDISQNLTFANWNYCLASLRCNPPLWSGLKLPGQWPYQAKRSYFMLW